MSGKPFGKSLRSGLFLILPLFLLIQNGAPASNPSHPAAGGKPDAPIEAELYFSSTPSVLRQVTLNFKVTPLRPAPNTKIKVELPEGFVLVAGQTELVEDLSEGETKVYQVEVRPAAPGSYRVAASAVSDNGAFVFGKTAELFVELGATTARVSANNILAGEPGAAAQTETISDFSERPAFAGPSDKPGLAETAAAVPGAGQIVVRGYWYYRDRNGVDRPLRDARVEIWDADTFSSDDFLDRTHTDNSGYFESNVIANSGDEAGGLDVYVKVFSADDFSVKVTDFSSNIYFAQSPTSDNVPSGYVDLGGRSITDANTRMAYYIYDKIANDAYDYLANNAGWVNSYNLQVRWSPSSNTGTYYIPGGTVDLVAGDRWDIDVFLHEYGHFVMYKIYGNTMPPGSNVNCNPHHWGGDSSLGCAWSEGWANYLQAAIQNDRFYDDTEDQTLHIDYEPPTPFASHAEDEGAVAASLWDVFDSGSESWDSVNNGIGGTWNIVANTRPNDVVGFYGNWMNSQNGSNAQVTSILQHHNVIPNPVLTASLTLSPGQPYVTGQTVTGRFSITNRGNRSITFEALTIGGRLNTDSNVVDFPAQTFKTLAPNETYQYTGALTFQQTGTYRFFPAYKLQGNVWRIGLLNEIPADTGVNYNLSFGVATNTIPVTVRTNPSGGSFTVDGTSYSSSQTFNWIPGSSHSVGTASPQGGGAGTQYVWNSWSDGGAISHNVAPTAGTTYTANFSTQFFLTMNAQAGGTVSPQSGWYNSGQGVSITASPNSGFSFGGWTGSGAGSFTGSGNPASVTMNGPVTESASFSQNPANVQVTVQSNPAGRTFTVDGSTYSSAQTFTWLSGSGHTVGTTSPQSGGAGTQYLWAGWSDGGASSHSVFPTANTTYTVNFTTQYFLTMNAGAGGTVSPSSNWFNSGQSLSISAVPNGGFNFGGWSGSGAGSYSGPNNPATVLMSGPVTQNAAFTTTTSPAPANDIFVNAQVISGGSGTLNGSNVGAGKEPGEPDHAGRGGGASVWYRWQAPGTGSATFTTAGSDFDTVLAVYTGSSVSALTAVAANDDAPSGGLQSAVTFGASAGTVYYIAVDGFGGATGNVTLNWNLAGGCSLRIDTVSPHAGRTSGGQLITLSGSFDGLSSVTLGGAGASWSNGGTNQITVTTPAHSAGPVTIALASASCGGYSKPNAFAYIQTSFTDDPLVAGVTQAKAQHVAELRQAVDSLRAVAGLPQARWTDPVLVNFMTPVKLVHVNELRAYLEEAAVALGYARSSYTDPSPGPGSVVKRVHIEELRLRVKALAGECPRCLL